MTYNGWTNYETWAVALWLDNDEGSYRHWRSEAQEAWDDARPTNYSTRLEEAARTLADKLKDELETDAEQVTGGGSIWSDLLGAALSEVNYREIAEGWLDEIEKREDEDEDEDEDATLQHCKHDKDQHSDSAGCLYRSADGVFCVCATDGAQCGVMVAS